MPKSQVRLSAGLSMYSPLHVNPTIGDALVTSNFAPGGGISVSYYQHIGKGFGLNLGLGINTQLYNIRLQNGVLSAGQLTLLDSYDTYRYFSPSWMLPLSVEKTFEGCNLGAGFFLVVSLGLSAQRYWSSSDYVFVYSEQTAEMVPVFESTMYRPAELFLSYFAKVGVARVVTSNSHAMQINLVYNYAPKTIAEGTYHYYQDVYCGEMAQKANYFGVEFVFGFNVAR